MNEFKFNIDELDIYINKLEAGDKVLLNGKVYTSRDAAHKRIFSLIKQNEQLPYDLKNACIYYAGPTPTPDNMSIGSCGPTTSGRMDPYTPTLLDNGLKAMIGKGNRSNEVYEAIIRNKAVYFCAIGGAGAIYAKHITSCKEIAFLDLGCESVKELVLNDFPVYVGIDSKGNSIFK